MTRASDKVSLGHALLKWPNGYTSCFCLRVDVDTARDARATSSILSLLSEVNVRVTFFVATGPDDAGRNLPHAIAHTRKRKYLLRYGFEGLRGLLLPALNIEEELEGWREILERRHEIGLHGYWHRRWVEDASRWSAKETSGAVEEGVRRFVRSFSFKPKAFAAPGFRVNESLSEILERAGFRCSSNTRTEGSFRPRKDAASAVFEIPVTCRNMEELMLDGLTEEQASGKVCSISEKIAKEKGLFCYYIHPSFELNYCQKGIRRLLLRSEEEDIWTPTLSEAVDWLRKNEDAEDTPDL